MIKKVKNVVPWTYAVEKLNDEETVGTFSDKEPHKANKSEFKIEKLIKRKCDELYVKWEGYDNFFDRWINKKDIIEMKGYFPIPYEHFGKNVKVLLYATNTDKKRQQVLIHLI